jgi:hypothetical protein
MEDNYGLYVVIDHNFIAALPFKTSAKGEEVSVVPTNRLAANQDYPTAKIVVVDHVLSDEELDEVMTTVSLNSRFKGQLATVIHSAYADLRSRGWLAD